VHFPRFSTDKPETYCFEWQNWGHRADNSRDTSHIVDTLAHEAQFSVGIGLFALGVEDQPFIARGDAQNIG